MNKYFKPIYIPQTYKKPPQNFPKAFQKPDKIKVLKREVVVRQLGPYAQTLILVNLAVVNFFSLLVIARNPPERCWRKLDDFFPACLTDLQKTQENQNLETKIYKRTQIVSTTIKV